MGIAASERKERYKGVTQSGLTHPNDQKYASKVSQIVFRPTALLQIYGRDNSTTECSVTTAD